MPNRWLRTQEAGTKVPAGLRIAPTSRERSAFVLEARLCPRRNRQPPTGRVSGFAGTTGDTHPEGGRFGRVAEPREALRARSFFSPPKRGGGEENRPAC